MDNAGRVTNKLKDGRLVVKAEIKEMLCLTADEPAALRRKDKAFPVERNGFFESQRNHPSRL